MSMSLTRSLPAALVLALGAAACSPATETDDPADCYGKCDGTGGAGDGELSLCVGIRGNGQRITAHFGALARVVEHYGLVDAVAGGSSGSISSFLLESIQLNPGVYDCGGAPCSATEAAGRAALLIKSIEGYIELLGASDEATAATTLAKLVGRIRAEGIEALLADDASAGAEALRVLLESPDVRDLVNPEVRELLATSPDPAYHARDIVEALTGALEFRADDPTIFVRPGIVSFPGFVDKVGRIASFYAGYGPSHDDALAAFLDDCAEPARGLAWRDIAALPAASSDATCGDAFASLLADYRARLLADEASYASRADDMIGASLPALISTSVLADDAVTAFEAARADYLAARPVTLDVDFADVTFGYWGRAIDLQRVAANLRGYADLKTRKLRSLGEATWREALAYSPAEPGLSRALGLPNGLVSAGGWSDLHPVLVLKNLGCERVIYVTRRGADSTFMLGVARMLGLDAAEEAELLDLSDPASSFGLSVSEADGVWCTDWDSPNELDIPAMIRDGYEAPFETSDPAFLEGASAYPNASQYLGIAGCTPGVAN